MTNFNNQEFNDLSELYANALRNYTVNCVCCVRKVRYFFVLKR